MSASAGGPSSDVTILLHEIVRGNPEALSELVTLLYPDLKRMAEHRMHGERPDHTIQPSALVSEFYLQVANCRGVDWRNKSHFLAVASQIMRRFLIDYARTHNAQKRGGGVALFEISELGLHSGRPNEVLIVNDLLDRLFLEEPRMAQVVEMRCFGGLTHSEIGEVLGIDERTAKRDWQVGRAWLKTHFEKGTRLE